MAHRQCEVDTWRAALRSKNAAMMDADPLAQGMANRSRLRIHAPAGDTGWSLPCLWRRVLARARGAPHTDSLPTVEIHDLPGRRLLTLSNAGALVDIVLPTGTYHVSALSSNGRRSYTVVLEQNATTDLHLLPAGARPPG